MKTTILSLVFPLLAFLILELAFAGSEIAQDRITITILYDNSTFSQAATAEWGFSCLIEGLEKTILFDAGGSGDVLSRNAKTLLPPGKLNDVSVVVLSHDHRDHTGGLRAALGSNSTATVYFGESFSSATEQMVSATGATPIRESSPVKLLPAVHTTGELHGAVNEQALIITVDSGLVVITGCSHPGVIQILERVKQLVDTNIYMVCGGFHWLNLPDSTVNLFIQQMKDMGVRKCGATHCTGDRAIELIKRAYGSDYVEMGVGRVITFSRTVGDGE